MIKLIFYINLIILIIFDANAENIKNIEIDGNKRITDNTIIVFSGARINQNISEQNLNDILKKLYETNFFSNVKVSLNNGILFISVEENKLIQSVLIKGIKNKNLINSVKNLIQVNEKKSYVKSDVEMDVNRIQNFLKASGYYASKIGLEIIENQNNTIDLIYNIETGEKAVVKKIKFTGDKIFKNNILRNVIVTEESKFWKFISKKKYLSESQVNLDERLLKNFYLNNGYYDVQISTSTATLIEKGEYLLTYNINAGKKFFFNSLNLILPTNYDNNNFIDLNNILKKNENSFYSLNKVRSILDEIDKIALSKEYEFINSSIEEKILEDNKININFIINETKKVYIDRIDIIGNDITNESTIRDLLILDEGDPLNEILNKKSENNLKTSGLFADVKTFIVDTSDDSKKNITFKLKEKPTGEISAGAGVGTSGQTLSFSIKENNFKGNGIKLNTSLSFSTNSVKGGLNLVIPNYNYSNKSLRFNLSRTDTDNFDTAGFKNEISNLTIGTGFEYKQNLFLTPLLEVQYENLETNTSASSNLKKQDGSYFDTNINYSFLYDKRNQTFQPSEGYFSSFNQVLPVISNNYSLKNNYDFKIYKQLNENLVGSFSFFLSTVNSLEGGNVRISDRLSIPLKKLRGFERGKIGPKDNNDFIGGNYISGISVSSSLPSFLPDLEEVSFNLFLDAANIWGVDYNDLLDKSSIKSSTGVSIDWITPVGPLNFTLSQPITKDSSDLVESFRFDIGTTF